MTRVLKPEMSRTLKGNFVKYMVCQGQQLPTLKETGSLVEPKY